MIILNSLIPFDLAVLTKSSFNTSRVIDLIYLIITADADNPTEIIGNASIVRFVKGSAYIGL